MPGGTSKHATVVAAVLVAVAGTAALVRITRRDAERARQVPAELAAELAHASGVGVAAWDQAKETSDFAGFMPYLEHQLELKQRYIECFSEAETPYDVLLDDFEEGTTTADVTRVFDEVADRFDGGIDLLVHSVAFAAAEDLEGRFTDTPRDRFWLALDVSAYSLVACARAAEPLIEARGGGSVLTMTYLGGERAVPHYNVMGVAKATLDASVRYLAWDLGEKNIRVNAISAGPVRTLAARSIAGFPTMEAIVEERAPLHRHIDSDDVGAAAAYLLSDDARNVTGTTLYVDSGYHAMGM